MSNASPPFRASLSSYYCLFFWMGDKWYRSGWDQEVAVYPSCSCMRSLTVVSLIRWLPVPGSSAGIERPSVWWWMEPIQTLNISLHNIKKQCTQLRCECLVWVMEANMEDNRAVSVWILQTGRHVFEPIALSEDTYYHYLIWRLCSLVDIFINS